jgi:hypothetical protein
MLAERGTPTRVPRAEEHVSLAAHDILLEGDSGPLQVE